MSVIGKLAKETAVYGLSSIVGRFLNWCLVPLYVYQFPTQEYGIVSYLYSYMAVLLVMIVMNVVQARDDRRQQRRNVSAPGVEPQP